VAALALMLRFGVKRHLRVLSIRRGHAPDLSPDDASYKTNAWAGSPIIVEPLRLVYCGIPKNACTLMKRFAMRATGQPGWDSRASQGNIHNPLKNGLVYLRDLPLQDARAIMRSSSEWTRTVVLRDPIVRFAAAFLDKCKRERFDGKTGRRVVDGNCPVRSVVASQREDLVLAKLERTVASQGLASINGHFRPQSMFCDLGKFRRVYVAIEMDRLEEELVGVIERLPVATWTREWGLAALNQTIEFVKQVNHDTASRELAARWRDAEAACNRSRLLAGNAGSVSCDHLMAARLRRFYKDDLAMRWGI